MVTCFQWQPFFLKPQVQLLVVGADLRKTSCPLKPVTAPLFPPAHRGHHKALGSDTKWYLLVAFWQLSERVPVMQARTFWFPRILTKCYFILFFTFLLFCWWGSCTPSSCFELLWIIAEPFWKMQDPHWSKSHCYYWHWTLEAGTCSALCWIVDLLSFFGEARGGGFGQLCHCWEDVLLPVRKDNEKSLFLGERQTHFFAEWRLELLMVFLLLLSVLVKSEPPFFCTGITGGEGNFPQWGYKKKQNPNKLSWCKPPKFFFFDVTM